MSCEKSDESKSSMFCTRLMGVAAGNCDMAELICDMSHLAFQWTNLHHDIQTIDRQSTRCSGAGAHLLLFAYHRGSDFGLR